MKINHLLAFRLTLYGSINIFAFSCLCPYLLLNLSHGNFPRSAYPDLISHRLPAFFPEHDHPHKFKRVNIKVRTKRQLDPQQGIDSYEYYN